MHRRNFLKGIAPVAALVGASVSVLGHAGTRHETASGKQYVFVFPISLTQYDATQIKRVLEEKGFKDPVVFCGADVKMYEVENALKQ